MYEILNLMLGTEFHMLLNESRHKAYIFHKKKINPQWIIDLNEKHKP